MSVDVQLAHLCPHYTIEERVVLGSDRMSLATRQPVASSGSVQITINNAHYIPSGGLFSSAKLVGSFSGPFNIQAGFTSLQISTATETRVLNVPSGSRVQTSQIVNAIRATDPQTFTVKSDNGYLRINETSTIGIQSTLSIRGDAANALGFDRQRGSKGRQIYPGWQLYKRPDSITNLYPRFNEPVKANPVFKVTYAAPPQRCLRCGGTLIENDYRFTPQGFVLLIDNENLLYQASLKIILTDLGSNPYHTWYGTTIRGRIGSKAIGGVAAVINEDVRRALDKFQTIQEEQAKYQVVTFKERLYRVLSVQTTVSPDNPYTFLVDVVVQNAASDPITLTIVFTVPGVISTVKGDGVLLSLG